MKIVFICNEFPPFPHGGLGVFIKNLTKNLAENSFDCTVIGHYPIKKSKFETINNVQVVRLKEFKIPLLNKILLFKILENFLNKIMLNLFLLKYEKNNLPDLIESYEWNGPFLLKPRTKLIIRLHGSNTAYSEFENKRTSRILKFYEALNIKLGDVFVSVSKHLLKISEESFGTITKSKHVIYNSYNDQLFKEDISVIRKHKKILFVGKFHERKGVFELFKILNEIFVLDSSFCFHFVGPHTEVNKLCLLNILNVEFRSKVIFSTSIPQINLSKVYCESGLMIMPSRAEAFGLTAIEAMACGCVVAMSDIPVAKEIIEDNVDGLLISINDYKASANRIVLLMQNQDLLNLMSKKAVQKVKENFSNQSILLQNINFYNECVYSK